VFEGICKACGDWFLKTVSEIMSAFVIGKSEARASSSGYWIWRAQWPRSSRKWKKITVSILGGTKHQSFTEAFVEYVKVKQDSFESMGELVNDLESRIVAKYATRVRSGKGDGGSDEERCGDEEGRGREDEFQKFSSSVVEQLARSVTVCH
jgi:hypothetical protein